MYEEFGETTEEIALNHGNLAEKLESSKEYIAAIKTYILDKEKTNLRLKNIFK